MTGAPNVRTAVVTGAGSGIGAATARLLEARRYAVIGVDRTPPAESGVAFEVCDLGDPAAIDALVARLPDPVDVLCNVAGVPGTRGAETVMRVNFLGLRHLTEALLARMPAGGAVVNAASCAGMGWRGNLPEVMDLLETPDFDSGLDWCRGREMDGPRAYDFSKEAVIVYSMAASFPART